MAFDYRAENAGEKQSQRLHQIERRIKETLSEKPELPKSIIISSKASKPERRLLLQLQNCVLTLPDAHKIGIEDISIYTNDKILLKGQMAAAKPACLMLLLPLKSILNIAIFIPWHILVNMMSKLTILKKRSIIFVRSHVCQNI